MPLINPYGAATGTWLRGSFHGHCDEHSGCSSVPLADSLRQYSEIGAGFITLTDHDHVTDLGPARQQYPDISFLHGFEYSTRENVVFCGPEVTDLYQLSLEEALRAAGDLLTIVCHPQPMGAAREYWTRPKLEALGTMPDGVEVYNGHYGTERGRSVGRQPLYNDFWDELLTAGHHIWGFGNDDFHDPDDFSNAWNMVNADSATPGSIVAAAKSGRSYATTGLLLKQITVDGDHVEIQLAAEAVGRFVGPGATVLANGKGASFSYDAGDEAYVRFEAESDVGRIFLQPLWRA
ncbi:MAG: hypothetical protein HN712_19765 [Gemmatimonadetes bacterium]|jgi:hypothetical protein|nr:hypothetical protein [Gemmatimonadota bacterium]MBT7862561.1 hypothetical protein [Gemmatimonadota bacterium]